MLTHETYLLEKAKWAVKLLVIYLLPHLSLAQLKDPQAPLPQEATPKEQIITKLFLDRDPDNFAQSITQAKAIGIPSQMLLEASFLFNVDHRKFKNVIQISKQFEQTKDDFRPKNSYLLTTKEEWLAVIEYGKALEAYFANDQATFKKHITQAFWLSPDNAPIFAQHIEELYKEELKKTFTLDKTITLTNILEKDPSKNQITIEQLSKDKKALILLFWSPWNLENQETLIITEILAHQAQQNNITLTHILSKERDAQTLMRAKDFAKIAHKDIPSHWLLDKNSSPSLQSQLLISKLPQAVIFSPSGKIIAHASLTDDKFWQALKNIAPNISSPLEQP